MNTQLGVSIPRKEAWDKVTGAAKYTADQAKPAMLHARLLTSTQAHALLIGVDTAQALTMPGVRAVVTDADTQNLLCGSLLRDMPPLARGKVRHFGEPIAIVVADEADQAVAAAATITVQYSALSPVTTIEEAVAPDPVLVHDDPSSYQRMESDIYPQPKSNIFHSAKIRKGDMANGWAQSEVTVEGTFHLPQSDHAAMETRAVQCFITPSGLIDVTTASQSPFEVRELLSGYFNVPQGKIAVHTPLVGGAFGGKAAVHLEVLAVLASQAAGGALVSLVNSREQDMATSPCKMGMRAQLKLGARRGGQITAAQMVFHLNAGAYADISPKLTKAVAVDCAGPYRIPNLCCDCFGVYTNAPYVTSYRGFGHAELTFCLERMMDKLSDALGMDPFDLRSVNALHEGDLTATQVKVTDSNLGRLQPCLDRLKPLIQWDEGRRVVEPGGLVRAKGMACLCKTSDTPTTASAAATVSFLPDGTLSLNCAAVEIGPGIRTAMAQILAETLRMDVDRVFVNMEVDTQTAPYYWKTVASMTTYMMGRAVQAAARDAKRQLLDLGATVLRCPAEDLDVENERVYLRADPLMYAAFQDLATGYEYENGNAVGGPIVGRGSYVMDHLTLLDRETGLGKAGRSWTLGAQAVEVEYDPKLHTYRLLKAATVLDAGRVLNPNTARGVVMGGMSMGLGLATREEFVQAPNGVVGTTSFRTYKMLRIGEEPEYLVDFVETPQLDAPFGARGIAEHGVIGIPAALANAISLAAGVDIEELPVTPELLWRKKGGA